MLPVAGRLCFAATCRRDGFIRLLPLSAQKVTRSLTPALTPASDQELPCTRGGPAFAPGPSAPKEAFPVLSRTQFHAQRVQQTPRNACLVFDADPISVGSGRTLSPQAPPGRTAAASGLLPSVEVSMDARRAQEGRSLRAPADCGVGQGCSSRDNVEAHAAQGGVGRNEARGGSGGFCGIP
jgi:hypothetical protein